MATKKVKKLFFISLITWKQKLLFLRSHVGFMKYFANTSWLFAEKVVRMIVGVFVGIWIARYLGSEQFGVFSYAQSVVGLFSAIAGLGLDGIVIRELIKDKTRHDELIGTTFGLKLIGAIVTLVILAVTVFLTSNDGTTNLLIFIIASSTIFQAFNVIDFYFQAEVLGYYAALANTITLLISSVVKIGLIIYGASLEAFAWSILFDSIILALGFIYFYTKHTPYRIKKFTFIRSTALSLLKDSWPLILSSLVVSVYMRIDQVMIMKMMNSEAVGQYAAAVRLSEAWYFIPMVIASSLFPAIINAKSHSKELYHARLQKLYTLMVWMGIGIAVPMSFLSDSIVLFLYGNQYSQAGGVLMVSTWAGVFVFIGVASSKWFIAENLQMLGFLRVFSGMATNIGLNFFLIPEYGIKGAAIATLISQATVSYAFDLFNKSTREMFLIKTKAFCFWTKINLYS